LGDFRYLTLVVQADKRRENFHSSRSGPSTLRQHHHDVVSRNQGPEEQYRLQQAFVRDRAGESLAHVFTLLSLVLPREPLQLAFRGLQTSDEHLRGTSLEYLDSVLPSAIRQRLWPFLEPGPARHTSRNREEAIAALLRSNESIVLHLEELKTRVPVTPTSAIA